MNEYFDHNTEKLLVFFQTLGGVLNPDSISFFKSACRENNISHVYNFFATFEQVNVRNILVAKPEILNQILQDRFIEIATFLITETNFSYEELDSLEEWNKLNEEDKKYIKYCIDYKNGILSAISNNNYQDFVSYYKDIEIYPRPSSLMKLIMNRIVKKDDEYFKMTHHFLSNETTKKIYSGVIFDILNMATFKEREDMVKYLIFDYKIPREANLEDLIYSIREMNLKAMFDSRDLYDKLKGLKDKSGEKEGVRGKI